VRNKLIASAVLACSALAVVAAPIAADARPHHQKQRVQVCHTTRGARNTGTVVGAVGGGLLGNALGHNTGSTLLGAGAGAVAGHEVARHNARKVCHWEYR
jgi:uncharacterized protein YcfJ